MIRLRRTLRVQTFDARASVALPSKRPELVALARLAADLGGTIDAADVARELLAPLPHVVGRLALERARDLGLLDHEGRAGVGRFRLTESGRLAAERGTVLVPEEGTWRMFWVRDPLVQPAILHVERIATTFADRDRDAIRGRKERREPRVSAERPPRPLEDARDQPVASIAGTGYFELRYLHDGRRGAPESSLSLELIWETDVSKPRLQIAGHLGLSKGKIEVPAFPLSLPEAASVVDYRQVWRDVVSAETGVEPQVLERAARQASLAAVPVRFEDVADDPLILRQMAKDLPATRVELDGLGGFSEGLVERVPYWPRSSSAAASWARWLQWDGITEYVGPRKLAAIADAVQERFPTWRDLPLHTAEELLQRARAEPKDPTSSFLLAPSDLYLWDKT